MKASKVEFRFRVAIISMLFFLGFYAPWERLGAHTSASPVRLWSWLAIQLSRTGVASVGNAYLVVTAVAVALAVAGALLRVWGTAYLGHFVMRNRAMQAATVIASGPYRYLRNPLYVGMLLASLAIAMLMPVTGALIFVLGIVIFTLRLIAGEEAFLAGELGEVYRDYKRAVPSIVPSLRPRLAASDAKGDWLQGVLAECFFVGTAGSFAAIAWDYDADLLTRFVIVCFGVSLVIHALISVRSGKTIGAS